MNEFVMTCPFTGRGCEDTCALMSYDIIGSKSCLIAAACAARSGLDYKRTVPAHVKEMEESKWED